MAYHSNGDFDFLDLDSAQVYIQPDPAAPFPDLLGPDPEQGPVTILRIPDLDDTAPDFLHSPEGYMLTTIAVNEPEEPQTNVKTDDQDILHSSPEEHKAPTKEDFEEFAVGERLPTEGELLLQTLGLNSWPRHRNESQPPEVAATDTSIDCPECGKPYKGKIQFQRHFRDMHQVTVCGFCEVARGTRRVFTGYGRYYKHAVEDDGMPKKNKTKCRNGKKMYTKKRAE